MNHQMICHRWAQRDEKLSIKGYAIYARGLTIYSWGDHFPIAQWGNLPATRGVVFFNSASYSSSTGKHKSYVSRSIPAGIRVDGVPIVTRVFTLPADLWPNSINLSNNQDLVDRAIVYYEAKATELYAKASRARTNADWLNDQAESELREAGELCHIFGIAYARPDLGELQAKAAERAAATAEATRQAREREAELIAARRLEARLRQAEWLDGTRDTAGYFDDGRGNALMRRSNDGVRLETSQGANCPWTQAVYIFRRVHTCKLAGKSWHKNGETIRAGVFQVDSIDAEGNMVAGCHRFAWEAMEALAIKEGVFA